MRLYKIILSLCFFITALSLNINAQEELDYSELPVMDYSNQKEYEIAEIKIVGAKIYDPNILVNMLGVSVGDKIKLPGSNASDIINKLWRIGLFSDVKIIASKIEDGKVWLEVMVRERPRMSDLKLVGIKKHDDKDLMDKINKKSGDMVNENVKNDITVVLKKHYRSKGYLNTTVKMIERADTNSVDRVHLIAQVDIGKKVKVKQIDFVGNNTYKDKRLRRTFKKTHQISPNIFHPAKYVEQSLSEDRLKLIEFYQKNGYRNFTIVSDTIEYLLDSKKNNRVKLTLNVEEGEQFHLRNIRWVGNTVYSTDYLNGILKIEEGGIYDLVSIHKRLSQDDDAVSNVYLDNGYLFSSIDPVELRVANDSIDLELRVTEGTQATVNNVIIQGNNKTNERVIRRELYVKPGDLFSKTKIVRDVRQIAQLGFFDETKIKPVPIPDPANGTVDILYQLEEKGNDQLELSAGWGAGMLIGRVGLKFNNFSLKNANKLSNWRPVPSGDGQQLGISWQTNGKRYSGWSITFVEPWLGGYKPNSLSVTLFHSSMGEYDNYRDYWNFKAKPTQFYKSTGISVGLGKRLKWPDDYFLGSIQATYQRYMVHNWTTMSYYRFPFTDGISDNINAGFTLQRNSVNATLFPTSGSLFSLSVAVTPPWSLIQGKNYKNASMEDKYRLIEYHKWEFKSQLYKPVIGKLVMQASYNLGYLGYYDPHIGYSPYEGFVLGGSGMQSYRLFGQDIVSLRGYKDYAFIGNKYPDRSAAPIYVKTNLELRYPVVTQPSSTIYVIAFLEGGNAWYDTKDFNPLSVKRAAGVGIRAFLPMFGLLGVDWGYGFDNAPAGDGYNKSQFQFTLGQQF